MRRGIRTLLALGTALTMASLATPSLAADDAAGPPAPALAAAVALPNLDTLDRVVYSYADAVVESYQVSIRSRGPSDIRQAADKIWVDVVRPSTTDPVVKFPTIMMSSPYFNTLGRGYKGECKTRPDSLPPGNPALGCDPDKATGFPEWYDEYFVPRGYAFAAMDLRGTRNSGGCQVYGDLDEVLDAVDVVDFLSSQPWSNGKVGMTGGSYDGTIANGAAAEQPKSGLNKDALAAIIPIRAIDAWYDYHFFNGVQSSSHAATAALFSQVLQPTDVPSGLGEDPAYPAYLIERPACAATISAANTAGYASPLQDSRSSYWAERDWAKDGATIRAATLIMHGLFDFNVKPHNAGYLWESLPADLPKRLQLFNGDHVDPKCPTREECDASGHFMPYPYEPKFVEDNHRWWLQFLKGVPAGALATPAVEVQRKDGHFDGYRSWPADTTDQALYLTPTGGLVPSGAPTGSASYEDSPSGGTRSQSFETAPFATDTRLSGQIVLDLLATIEGVDTTFAVTVRDIPPGLSGNPPTDNYHDAQDTGPFVVTYGWLRAYYRDSVPARGVSRPTGGSLLASGTTRRYAFGSLHTDYVVPAGHTLRFTVANNGGGTVAANTGQTITLLTGSEGSRVLLPVAALDADGPSPVVPEVPVAALLPLAAGAILVGAYALRRRRGGTVA